jgi:hypothetical protein
MATNAEILEALPDEDKGQFQMFLMMVEQMPNGAIRMMVNLFINELGERGSSMEADD